jgi:hypothetical protein
MGGWLCNKVGAGVHRNYGHRRFRVYGDRLGAKTGAGRNITLWVLHMDIWKYHGYLAVSS